MLPVSFFERAGQAFFNSVAIVDADGAVLGVYRKSHIPDAGGYQEKYYFSPGDTGFRVWDTAFGRIGVGICWDQWFPESARAMALQGAEVLLYPTAIGSDPPMPGDSRDAWQLVQRGHAIANAMPVVASNRIGSRAAPDGEPSIRFYGSSFVASATGELVARGVARPRGGRHGDRRPRRRALPARGLVVLPRPAPGALPVAALDGRDAGAGRRVTVTRAAGRAARPWRAG